MSLPALRDYQATLVDQTAAYLRAEPERGVCIQAATGSGKTRVGLELALRHLARDSARRVLWLAHRAELIDQPARKLRGMGARVATLRPGAPPVTDESIIVASLQTLVERGASAAPTVSLVVYDEARHVADAPVWSEVARAVGAGRPRIGLDATPTGDMRGLFDVMICGPSIRALIDGGYLVQPVHYAPAEEVEALAAHPLDAYLRHIAPGRAIVFAANVAHADQLAHEAHVRGLRARSVHGGTGAAERRASVDAYVEGRVDLLINCHVFVDGFDAPETRGIVIARGVSNETTWVQLGGRALRSAAGKSRGIIVDPYGLTHRYGLLDEPRTWALDGTPARRTSPLSRVVRCPRCLAVGAPSSICAGCGHKTPPAPPPKVLARELIEVRQSEGGAERYTCLVRFVRSAVQRGHNPWSAAHRYRGTYGHAPPDGWMRRAMAEAKQ